MTWLERRRERKAQEQWELGYDWAAGLLLRGERTPKDIDDNLEEIHHPFDRGARAAIDHLIEIGIAKDDRV